MLYSLVLVVVVALGGDGGMSVDPADPMDRAMRLDSPGSALALRQPDIPLSPSSHGAAIHSPVVSGPVSSRSVSPPPSAVTGGVFASVLALAIAAGQRAQRAAPHVEIAKRSLEYGLRSDVSVRDVRDVSALLLSVEDRVAADIVMGLSTVELERWLGRYGEKGPVAEQNAALAWVARKLSASQLVRLIGAGNAASVTAVVAAEVPRERRAEVAFEMWRSLEPGDDGWESIEPLLAAAGRDATESLVAAWWERGDLETVIGDLAGHHRPWYSPDRVLGPLAGFVDAAVEFRNPALKAAIFVHSVEAVDDFAGSTDELDLVLERLTRLVRSDPVETVGVLNHRVDIHGDATSGWVRMMIENDRTDGLDALLADLLGAPDRLGWFTTPGLDDGHPFPNAANLGFYVGAYHLAIEDVAGDAAEKIALVGTLFSIVTGIVPGPKGSKIKLPLGPLVDAHAAAVVEGIDAEAGSLKQALWDLAKPRAADGRLWNGAGTTEFQNSWVEVVEVR